MLLIAVPLDLLCMIFDWIADRPLGWEYVDCCKCVSFHRDKWLDAGNNMICPICWTRWTKNA